MIIHLLILLLFQRKRGRPPKTKSDVLTSIVPCAKHPNMNTPGISLTPTMDNQVIRNDQHGKVSCS